MKIIQKGDERKGWHGEWKCQRCGCKWLMEEGDTEPQIMYDQRDGDAWHMPCPTCKSEQYRATGSIPQQWDR